MTDTWKGLSFARAQHINELERTFQALMQASIEELILREYNAVFASVDIPDSEVPASLARFVREKRSCQLQVDFPELLKDLEAPYTLSSDGHPWFGEGAPAMFLAFLLTRTCFNPRVYNGPVVCATLTVGQQRTDAVHVVATLEDLPPRLCFTNFQSEARQDSAYTLLPWVEHPITNLLRDVDVEYRLEVDGTWLNWSEDIQGFTGVTPVRTGAMPESTRVVVTAVMRYNFPDGVHLERDLRAVFSLRLLPPATAELQGTASAAAVARSRNVFKPANDMPSVLAELTNSAQLNNKPKLHVNTGDKRFDKVFGKSPAMPPFGVPDYHQRTLMVNTAFMPDDYLQDIVETAAAADGSSECNAQTWHLPATNISYGLGQPSPIETHIGSLPSSVRASTHASSEVSPSTVCGIQSRHDSLTGGWYFTLKKREQPTGAEELSPRTESMYSWSPEDDTTLPIRGKSEPEASSATKDVPTGGLWTPDDSILTDSDIIPSGVDSEISPVSAEKTPTTPLFPGVPSSCGHVAQSQDDNSHHEHNHGPVGLAAPSVAVLPSTRARYPQTYLDIIKPIDLDEQREFEAIFMDADMDSPSESRATDDDCTLDALSSPMDLDTNASGNTSVVVEDGGLSPLDGGEDFPMVLHFEVARGDTMMVMEERPASGMLLAV